MPIDISLKKLVQYKSDQVSLDSWQVGIVSELFSEIWLSAFPLSVENFVSSYFALLSAQAAVTLTFSVERSFFLRDKFPNLGKVSLAFCAATLSFQLILDLCDLGTEFGASTVLQDSAEAVVGLPKTTQVLALALVDGEALVAFFAFAIFN